MTDYKLIAMGVSGCGKSTFGAALAARLGLEFLDGDDLHPAGNIAKMAAGIPLDDADRAPWLAEIGARLAAPGGRLVACSALKRAYRDTIRAAAPGAVFLHLTGPREVLAARMANRPGHFMPTALLDSQLSTLEPPGSDERALDIALDQPLAAQVEQALAAI